MSHDEYSYTDADGDTVSCEDYGDGKPCLSVSTAGGRRGAVVLSADAARELGRKLLEWAGEPTPEFKVGDRVEVEGEGRATVTHVCRAHGMQGFYVVRPDRDGGAVTVSGSRLTPVPIPDYAALAAKFKPGDLAIVGDSPGTEADGSGFVEARFAGRAVNVVSREEADDCVLQDRADLVPVKLGGRYSHPNYIHVAHLTKVQAVKW